MRRRAFLSLLGGATLVHSKLARAQKSPVRIGFLASGRATSAYSLAQIEAIRVGLADNGLVEKRDYILETRFAAGDYARFPDLAKDLARSEATIILTNTIASVRAAQALSPPVAVVMLSINDPVQAGLIKSLAKTGNSTTGMATLAEDLTSKLLDFQKLIVPNARTIAALFNKANSTGPRFFENLKTQAAQIGITALPFPMNSAGELDSTLAALAAQRPDTLQLISDSGTLDRSDQIASFALTHKIPSFGTSTIYAESGGLLTYGSSQAELIRRSGYFVKRIIEGVPPSDLPVEQPTSLYLVVNLKTAKELGVVIRVDLQLRADKIIE